jgi:hypothetical protein
VPNWFGINYPKNIDRYNILIEICNLIRTLEVSLFYTIIDKAKIKTTVFEYKDLPKLRSWEFLIERYNLYLSNQKDKRGIIVSDAVVVGIEKKYREFAKAIFTTSIHVQKVHFIESILFEPSESSNILQLVDVAAFACGKKQNSGDDKLFNILQGKIFNYAGNVTGCGIKIWPE